MLGNTHLPKPEESFEFNTKFHIDKVLEDFVLNIIIEHIKVMFIFWLNKEQR